METNPIKLYSISAAERELCLGKDAVYRLVSDGRIGYNTIYELIRFHMNWNWAWFLRIVMESLLILLGGLL